VSFDKPVVISKFDAAALFILVRSHLPFFTVIHVWFCMYTCTCQV
jgi:hypothetical protein